MYKHVTGFDGSLIKNIKLFFYYNTSIFRYKLIKNIYKKSIYKIKKKGNTIAERIVKPLCGQQLALDCIFRIYDLLALWVGHVRLINLHTN